MYWKVPIIAPLSRQARRRRGQHRQARSDTNGHAGLCEPEIEQLRSGPRQPDVAGLQIPMDDAGAMGFVERVGDLSGDRQRLIER